MLVPFESVELFTVGSLVLWYINTILCGITAAYLAAGFESITYKSKRVIIGFIVGIGFHYVLSWLYLSKAASRVIY